MVEGCISVWAASYSRADDEVAVLEAPRDQFIGYLSTVNLVSLSETTLEKRASGNSRDPPSRFLFYCQTEECERTFFTALRRDKHQVNCRSPQDLEDVQDETFDSSPAPAPKAKKAQRKRKQTDTNKADEGYPKPCPDSDICGTTKDFANAKLLASHQVLHHDPNWPQDGAPCNVPGCLLPRDHMFISREQFRRHLSGRHMLDAKQALVYVGKIIPLDKVPRVTSNNFTPTRCLFPKCNKTDTETEFANYSDYLTHLIESHGLTEGLCKKFMPAMDALQRLAAA